MLVQADTDDQLATIGGQYAGRVGPFLRVEEFDAAHRRLREHGVQFVSEPRDELYGRVCVFIDVAGNRRLTQAALADRSGIARPNIATYEHGRREPLFDTAMALLKAAGAHVEIEPAVAWTWTDDRRPYAIPSRLWRLSPAACLRHFDPGPHLWWSGPRRELDLAQRNDHLHAYELVLREGTPSDIEAIVDGVLLREAWPDLSLPRPLRAAWTPLIHAAGDEINLAAAS